MKGRILLMALLSAFLMCCEDVAPTAAESIPPTQQSQAIQYLIPRGEHNAIQDYQSFATARLSFQAKFDSSAIYSTRDPQNQLDTNKLMGIADCGTHHHTNSARFGWRWFRGSLEIWAYCYVNGERSSLYLGTVPLGEYHSYRIRFEDGAYVFRLDQQQEVVMGRSCMGAAKGYKLFPYFGGDEPAPHDISVWVIEEQ